MNPQHYTTIFIIGVFLLVVAYDLWVIIHHGTEASISHVVRSWNAKNRFVGYTLAFALGALFWHFFGLD